MTELSKYIGTGLQFPFRFNSAGSVSNTSPNITEFLQRRVRQLEEELAAGVTTEIELEYKEELRELKKSSTVNSSIGDKIDSSIRLILSTFFGEMVGIPTVGSEHVGDSYSTSEFDKEETFVLVADALARNEPRITVIGISSPPQQNELNNDKDENYLPLYIQYALKNSELRIVRFFTFNLPRG